MGESRIIRCVMFFAVMGAFESVVSWAETVEPSSIDAIVGERQSNSPALGYYVDSANNTIGITGSAGSSTRTDYNVVLGFPLPRLRLGSTLRNVWLNFEITLAHDQWNLNHPDLDIYLLKTADPSGSGTDFFYHGVSDPSTNVVFVKATYTYHDHDPTNFPDNAETRAFRLEGEALALLQSLYGGDHIPDQAEVFFRFNLDIDPPLNNMARYLIDTAAGEVSLSVNESLFYDTFDRANSSDLNAAADGKGGFRGSVEWSTTTVGPGAYVDINSNRLRIDNGSNSSGQNGGIAWLDHNFKEPVNEFTVSIDIATMFSGGDGRSMGFGVGNSRNELVTAAGATAPYIASDVGVSYDGIGGTQGIIVFHGGTSQGYIPFPSSTPSRPDQLMAVFTYDDMNAGSALNYEVFLDGRIVTTGSTTWSGDEENYIHVQCNTTNPSTFDNFTIESPTLPPLGTMLKIW